MEGVMSLVKGMLISASNLTEAVKADEVVFDVLIRVLNRVSDQVCLPSTVLT